MLKLRAPTPDVLRDLATSARDVPVTYQRVGATLTGDLPAGYVHDADGVVLGAGASTFRRAKQALADWQVHRGSGITVSSGAMVRMGETVALAAPLPFGFAVAVCRIVGVVDEADRYGFAYGTLPEHPESGEELFLVERDHDDTVRFRITAFSKPRLLAARLASPVARYLQVRALRAYLDAMQRAVQRVSG